MEKNLQKAAWVFFLVVGICIAWSSREAKRYQEKGKPISEYKLEEERLQQYADSMVSLSFKGIALGAPIEKAIRQAKDKENIYDVLPIYDGFVFNDYFYKYDENTAYTYCEAKLSLPDMEDSIEVNIHVESYQDTIYRIVVTSRDYESREKLEDLYNSRYNEHYSIGIKNGKMWKFKNQLLKIESQLKVKSELYVKNPEMQSPEYRYGKKETVYWESMSITYLDAYHYGKFEEYALGLEESRINWQEIQEREKNIADSIKREEKKRNDALQEI